MHGLSERMRQLMVMVALMLIATLYSLHLGMDVSWDLLNYHLYAPLLLDNTRLSVDFLGGGPQGYFNPLALWPFQAMVARQWPPIVIGTLLAALHSLNLIFVYLLSWQVLFRNHPHRGAWSLLAVTLAALSPVYWGAVGGSFIDATVSIPVLAAVWCLARAIVSPQANRWIVAAGFLLGAGVGLKLSVSVFALAAALALFLVPPAALSMRQRIFAVLVLSLAGGAGWLITGGWWAWRLHQEFGNPFFPLFNHVFHSPDYPVVASAHHRFTPQGWLDYLTWPMRVLLSSSWVYVENRAPDIRPAALCLLLLVAAAVRMIGRFRGTKNQPSQEACAVHWLWLFMLVSYLVWSTLSGNGRYALPFLLLVGVVLAHGLSLLPAPMRPASVACVLIAAQAWVMHAAGNPRWNPQPWAASWVTLQVPDRLRNQPHGFLSLQLNSTSYIAPFVHPDSGFASLQGILPLYPGEVGDARVRKFLQRHEGRLEVLLYVQDAPVSGFKTGAEHPGLAPWGLELDPHTCERITLINIGGFDMGLYSCSVRVANSPNTRFTEERKRLTPLFDRIQAACPKLFDPPGWPLTFQGQYWMRRHVATDIEVILRRDRFYYSRLDFGPFDVDLGSLSDWERGTARPDCVPPARHYEVSKD